MSNWSDNCADLSRKPKKVEVTDITRSTATVTWDAPSLAGNGITFTYKVEMVNRDSNYTKRVSGEQYRYRLKNLTEGKKYTVFVISVSGGKDTRSDPFEFFTRLDPGNKYITSTFDPNSRLLIVVIANDILQHVYTCGSLPPQKNGCATMHFL